MVILVSQQSILETINDVFVLDSSGVPYFSTCFGGEICKKKPDHLLQSGFIAALFSYSMEFGQRTIRSVEFEDGKMVFEKRSVNGKDILFVFFTSCEAGTQELRPVVKEAANAFIKQFYRKVATDLINTEEFNSFSDTLLNLKLINRKAKGPIKIRKNNSFLSRLRKYFTPV